MEDTPIETFASIDKDNRQVVGLIGSDWFVSYSSLVR